MCIFINKDWRKETHLNVWSLLQWSFELCLIVYPQYVIFSIQMVSVKAWPLHAPFKWSTAQRVMSLHVPLIGTRQSNATLETETCFLRAHPGSVVLVRILGVDVWSTFFPVPGLLLLRLLTVYSDGVFKSQWTNWTEVVLFHLWRMQIDWWLVLMFECKYCTHLHSE